MGPEPRSWSEQREPWRVLKSSVAISFSSGRRRKWRPEALTPEVRSQVIEALEARLSIRAAQTELRRALGELVEAASMVPKFRLAGPVWMQPTAELRRAAKRIIWEAEPLTARRQELGALLMRIEAFADEIDLLANGFLEVREKWSGKISMRFALGRRLTLSPAEVKAKAAPIRSFVLEAVEMLAYARETIVRRIRLEDDHFDRSEAKMQERAQRASARSR